ncbi:MAG: hypothetical protein JWM10_3087 [Myxococcaceae bacterium]|nr:hypothetical protein [Myxococcaceae bacterium]
MTYRDPREALQAENDCLRQELKEAHEEIAAARGVPEGSDYERRRWAMGMRCLGSLAMVAPFLAMMTMCEHRAMRRAAWHSAMAAAPEQVAPSPTLGRRGCRMATPAVGFEHFTEAIERPARVTETNVEGLAAGTACTVRVAPVAMLEFNCHVDVVCGGRSLYGALPTGYAHCDVDRRHVTRAFDPDPTALDGDGAVTVDLGDARVSLEDRAGGTVTRTVLALDRPPALR